MEFKITGTSVPVSSVYDNEGAHNQIKLMMQMEENISVKFFTTRDNYPCAWIESSKVSGFKYLFKQEGLTWLFNYLTEGNAEDFGISPMEMEPYKEGEDNNVQLSILKQVIASGKRIQFVPLFRERNGYISATAPFFKGKIYFKLQRSEELIDYLRENDQLI